MRCALFVGLSRKVIGLGHSNDAESVNVALFVGLSRKVIRLYSAS
jgi:hypothetical protein